MTITTKNNQVFFIIRTSLSKRSDMMNLECSNICFLAIGTFGSSILEQSLFYHFGYCLSFHDQKISY